MMQVQIQALLAAQGGVGMAGEAVGSNMESHMEVAKPAIFNREAGKVGGFIMAYRLFLRMKLRGSIVEEQVQWVLSYVQGGLADVWKENIMEELEAGKVEYENVEEFLTSLKKEFGGGEKKAVKAGELRKMEQREKTMEEFVQEFKRAARESGHEERPLMEEFQRGMNGGIRRKLMESENLPTLIEQWYRRAMALDRNWRESRREEERLRKKEVAGETEPTTTFGVAEEATIASAGNNRACSNERSGENKYSGSKGTGDRTGYGDSSEKGFFCNGNRWGKELLCMWEIQAHGLPL